MQTFCTITTAAYFPFAKTLHDSLQRYEPGTELQVLIVDEHSSQPGNGLKIISINELAGSALFKEIEKKYAHTDPDTFRWALKPVLIGYLLEKGYSKVIFADPDLYFVGPSNFLFNHLNEYPVLLTPHWADLDIINNPDSISAILKGGLYNAGFVGTSAKGLEVMKWWAALCHYKMEKDVPSGFNDDQKYLDLLPVQFENIGVLQHQGCNLAGWNIQRCKREMVDGKLMINKKYEPVFIHFAKDTITNILNRNDALLKAYLDDYINALKKNGYNLPGNLENLDTGQFHSPFYKLKHSARIRTRIKRFFFRLAEKL